MDVALEIIFAQSFDLNVELHSMHAYDVASPIIQLSDAKHHASLLSNFLLNFLLYFGVNEIISFQKLVRN